MPHDELIPAIDFKAVFEALPGSCILMRADSPRFTIVAVSRSYTAATGFDKDFLKGKGVFEAFPPNPADPENKGASLLKELLENLLAEKKMKELVMRYDTQKEGVFSKRFWRTVNKPLFDRNGHTEFILQTTEEITDGILDKAHQEEIRSMKKVHDIFIQAPVAIHILKGKELLISYANDAALALWKSTKDIIGQKLADLLPEIIKTGYEAQLNKVRESGELLRGYEQAIVWEKDDSTAPRFYNYVFQPYFEDDKTSAAGVIVFLNEITERVKTERAFKESEHRFQQIANTLPLVVWTASPDGGLTFISNQWEEFYGNPVADSLGAGWAKFVHPEDIEKAAAKWAHSLGSGEEYETEFRVQHKDGNYRWVLVRAVPFRNDAGAIKEWYGSNTDISPVKHTEEALQKSEENLRNTILKAPVAMCIFRGPEHVVEIANDRMMHVWGAVGREVMGIPIFTALPEAKDQGFELILNTVRSTGETYSAQDVPISLPRENGVETVYVTFVFEAYRESAEEVAGIIAVAIDVTAQVIARKQIEEVIAERTKELADANVSLQRSNAELAQFAYIASHDLQEPLRKISVFSQMLGAHLTHVIDAQTQNFLGKINNSVARMITLVRDVLMYSELSKENTLFKELDLNETAEGILADFELMIEQKNAIVQFDNLPEIEAIPLQMSQLFSNLISNALKFSREGVAPTITVTARELPAKEKEEIPGIEKDAVYYNIEFKDNGIGFNDEYSEQIFNIFQRLHGKSAYSGTGIGLAMCRKILQNHKGRISAISEEGQGAVFNLILPAKQPPA